MSSPSPSPKNEQNTCANQRKKHSPKTYASSTTSPLWTPYPPPIQNTYSTTSLSHPKTSTKESVTNSSRPPHLLLTQAHPHYTREREGHPITNKTFRAYSYRPQQRRCERTRLDTIGQLEFCLCSPNVACTSVVMHSYPTRIGIVEAYSVLRLYDWIAVPPISHINVPACVPKDCPTQAGMAC